MTVRQTQHEKARTATSRYAWSPPTIGTIRISPLLLLRVLPSAPRPRNPVYPHAACQGHPSSFPPLPKALRPNLPPANATEIEAVTRWISYPSIALRNHGRTLVVTLRPLIDFTVKSSPYCHMSPSVSSGSEAGPDSTHTVQTRRRPIVYSLPKPPNPSQEHGLMEHGIIDPDDPAPLLWSLNDSPNTTSDFLQPRSPVPIVPSAS
ncbi:hypothetical protein EDB83DRAFT_439360 [Lactarius deliciosus]|nr:hypothetical protein EDB83DRAFT_439360 [Lactarius deliciosus]